MATLKINHTSIDIEFSTERDCRSEIDNLHHFVCQRIANVLDQELSAFPEQDDVVIKIEDMNLDLGEVDFSNYRTQFETRFRSRLKKELNRYLATDH